MDIKIRREESRDIEKVWEVVRAAFSTEAGSRPVDALRASGKAILPLVAVHGDDVLGHILFSAVSTTPAGDAAGVGLAPVTVQPNAQRQGIGSQLFREGLRHCQKLGFDWRALLVYAMNIGLITSS